MKYFYFFILTLFLISYNERGYAISNVQYGTEETVTNSNECRYVMEKGKILASTVEGAISANEFQIWHKILYEGYIYKVVIHDFGHICFSKRKFHDK